MKKIFSLILLSLTLSFYAEAQQMELESYDLHKCNIVTAERTLVVGEYGNEVVSVVDPARGILATHQDFEVHAFNQNHTTRTLELADTKGYELITTNIVEGKLYLLFSNRTKNSYALLRGVVNLADMTLSTPLTPIYQEETAKSDIDHLRAAKSDNGDFIGLAFGVYHNATQEFQSHEMLLDNTLEELWVKQYPMNPVNAVYVTNEGQLKTMGYYNNKKNQNTKFIFGEFDENGEDVQEVMLDVTNVEYGQLLNCINGKFVFVGLLGDGREVNTTYSGIYGVVYDLNSHRALSNTHEFTNDEINVFENSSLKSKVRNAIMNGLDPRSTAATDFGGAVSYARRYTLTITDVRSGSTRTECYQTGAMVIALDTNCNFVWSKPIRTYMKENGRSSSHHVNICAQGNTVYLVQSEAAKNGEVYDISPKCKQKFFNRIKSRTAVYAIAQDGTVSKRMLGEAERNKITTPLMSAGNGVYWFVSSVPLNSTLNKLQIK